jgi:PST family polysaccharide transporter
MSLRETAMRGGVYLAGRELLGLGLRFGGVLVVTRLIGPASFGLYAGALALVTLLATLAQLGSEVYLVRLEHEPDRKLYDEIFTILLVSTTLAVILGAAGLVVYNLFVGAGDTKPFAVLLLALPLGVLWAPAQARLERGFHFRRMAMLQLSSDVMLYLVAVPLAFAGAGVWAPIAGTFASYGWLLLFSYVLARLLPRLAFSWPRTVELARYGAAFTPAGILGRAETLVNPLIVGPFLGAASVGYVALALRLVDTVSFVLRATYRVSLVSFARVQNDPGRLRRGFEEMMSMQVLALGPILVAMTATAPWLLPALFGDAWTPTLKVLPFVAAGSLAYCIFNTHIAFLYVMGRPAVATVVGVIRLALLVVGALLLVPPFGITGYGIAVLVTTFGFIVADRRVAALLEFRYGLALRWALAFLPALFTALVVAPWGLILFVPLLVALRDRAAREQVKGYIGFMKRIVRTGNADRGESPSSGSNNAP